MSVDPTTTRSCEGCESPVDTDGYALSGCAWNSPAECEMCGACYCDGSC